MTLITAVTTEVSDHSSHAASAAMGDGMIIYNNYASAYAAQNPTYSGVPTAAMLGLPTWYVTPWVWSGTTHTAVVSAYLQAGKAYTYYTGSDRDVLGYLSAKLQNGYGVGTDNHGVLLSATLPATITSTYTIPALVPSGSVVLMPQ
jgi:hypothetical protein